MAIFWWLAHSTIGHVIESVIVTVKNTTDFFSRYNVPSEIIYVHMLSNYLETSPLKANCNTLSDFPTCPSRSPFEGTDKALLLHKPNIPRFPLLLWSRQ